MEQILFFLVILAANIIQGITGFAGTILAMPPSLMLVGYNVAKPVLNVLGLLSGVYVFAEQRRNVNWKEVKRIVLVMAVGIFGGIFLKNLFVGKEDLLYKLLGIFVIFLAVQGLYGQLAKKKRGAGESSDEEDAAEEAQREIRRRKSALTAVGNFSLLSLAGIVHGIFVSGGPLLIGYLTKRIEDKVSFRATISTVWIVLNTIIMMDDIRNGLWTPALIQTQLIAIPFLLAGMFIGSKLYAKMSQRVFMILTYILLFVSGISLFVK